MKLTTRILNWPKCFIHWLGERLKDLFYATGNENLELARVVTGILTGLIAFAVYWNSVVMRQAIQLGELLNGLGVFIGAAGLGIGIKEWFRNKTKGSSNETTNNP